MGNPKSGRGRLRELCITKFKSQFKQGFTKVVVTGAGRLQEWLQGELQLHMVNVSNKNFNWYLIFVKVIEFNMELICASQFFKS